MTQKELNLLFTRIIDLMSELNNKGIKMPSLEDNLTVNNLKKI